MGLPWLRTNTVDNTAIRNQDRMLKPFEVMTPVTQELVTAISTLQMALVQERKHHDDEIQAMDANFQRQLSDSAGKVIALTAQIEMLERQLKQERESD